jgi:glycosyltransferase involved in cell wall biosynthesis
MRVLQIIDSLHPGGAERMAILYANALSSKIERSYLCCTREEGILKSSLNKDVDYLHLRKNFTFDIRAILQLRDFIKSENIDIVHAHSSSYFIVCIMKLSGIKTKLIWHDHYGNSEFLKERNSFLVRFLSYYFDGVISVNDKLKNWAKKKLFCGNIIQINNFCSSINNLGGATIKLKGDPNATKFICVANIRPQKDHLTLIKAFEMMANNKNASLHLIGEDPVTNYSKSVLNYIDQSPIKKSIYYYGIQTNITEFLKQGDIAVLSSVSEGLPVALLEYGIAGLPVISSDVGQCKKVIGDYGLVVRSDSIKKLSKALSYYYNNEIKRSADAKKFNNRVLNLYSERVVIKKVTDFYNNILSN